ncbi:Ferric iron reductase protein FhuF, involved in iron transport [Gracilibacillus orientalis]|uniref:Ferric iron reductase protein FhuF, involved in iron transport n=2 Tax=Gracilibacillus orientalis TaxID=334253 RepID=A0A1I4KNT0_9BACI|nr:Ferric iron reductase protein FhuF, involved in iron transport [Gracilibacillus orientalis]
MNDLQNFKIEYHVMNGVPVKNLLQETTCRQFLQKQMKNWHAPHIVVAASMFAKRYAYMAVSSTLFSLVQHQTVCCLTVDKLLYGENHMLQIPLDEINLLQIKDENREKQYETLFSRLFAEQITPLFEVMQKVSKIKSSVLWENIAVRINSIYQKLLAQDLTDKQKKQVYQDFIYLKNANGAIFGLRENPIRDYLKIDQELEKRPCRVTCCLFHRLEKKNEDLTYCKVCPLPKK